MTRGTERQRKSGIYIRHGDDMPSAAMDDLLNGIKRKTMTCMGGFEFFWFSLFSFVSGVSVARSGSPWWEKCASSGDLRRSCDQWWRQRDVQDSEGRRTSQAEYGSSLFRDWDELLSIVSLLP